MTLRLLDAGDSAVTLEFGHRVAPLGVERFGQTGNLADLYAAYRLDGAAITEGAASPRIALRFNSGCLDSGRGSAARSAAARGNGSAPP